MRGLVVGIAVAWGAVLTPCASEEASDPAATRPGLALTGLDGETERLEDLRGKVVVLNFWATWCAPCVEELPLLVAIQRDWDSRGVQVVGASADTLDARESVEERAR